MPKDFLNRKLVIELSWRKGFWLAVGIVIAATAIYWVPWSEGNAPAWVQAIGSIIAIVVAICVALNSHERDLDRRAEDQDAIDFAHSLRLYMLVWEARMAAEQLLKKTHRKIIYDEMREGSTNHEVLAECARDNQRWFSRQVNDIDFFQRIMHRAMFNLDDDLSGARHIIAAKFRFNLSVLISKLEANKGHLPDESFSDQIQGGLDSFRIDRDKLIARFPRLVDADSV